MNPEDGAVEADPELILDKVDSWVDGFFRLIPNIAVAIVVLLLFVGLGLLCAWAVRRMTRSRGRADLGAVIGSVFKWIVWIAGGLFALTIVMPSIRPGDLIAGLGIGSVAIGFAFKDILQNLLAGILILIRQPFEVGDQIVAGDYEGTVEHIETRATLIRTYDGKRVVIPNSDVYTNAITVNTAFEKRRSEYGFGITYGSDTARAIAVAIEAAESVEGVLSDPAPQAFSTDLGDFAKVVKLWWWTRPEQLDVVRTGSEVMLAVEDAFARNGIDIPFPTQTVLFHDETKETG
ncbi:mechanosensitive ion channel family protein [Jannaschia marina]|uniref:mechanosensitive ion channel family protein n=1 Tax=Jannaschia marina TaxID=2741674 RepID=UPI0015CD44B8|nr:mechanosensitive ion channel family protein [Jannaschia marina]